MFTFGHQETEGQLVRAYRSGNVSLAGMEQGIEASFERALVVGTVTVALTIATAGLAGPVLGTSATVGQQALYWGATGALTTAGVMGTESVYTYATRSGIRDPMSEAIYGQRQHTPLQILGGSALGFGIGAFFGAAGAYLARPETSRALVVASAEGQFEAPAVSGMLVEEITPGVIRITSEGHPAMVLLDQSGMRVLMPAGTGMRVVAEVPWAEASAVRGMLPSGGAPAAPGPLSLSAPPPGGLALPHVWNPALAAREAGRGTQVLLEPFAGPDLGSSLALAGRNPSALVVATEARFPPSALAIQAAEQRGVVFLGENYPAQIPVGGVDRVQMRFPLPHAKGMETLYQDFGPHVAHVQTERGVVPTLETIQALEGAIESVQNYGQYALERLRPGGTMDIVFHEAMIHDEVAAIQALRYAESGLVYRLEVVARGLPQRGEVAPHSGFGISSLTDQSPVHQVLLRKVLAGPVAGNGAEGLPRYPHGATAGGADGNFSYRSLPESAGDVPTSSYRHTGQHDDGLLTSYANARRSAEERNPATAASRGEGPGPYIRDNLYTGSNQRRVTRRLGRKGVLEVSPNGDAVRILDADRYLTWLERAYRHRGGRLLDPRMRRAIGSYIEGNRLIPSVGHHPERLTDQSFAGSLPGTHAEVLAINDLLIAGDVSRPAVATVTARTGDPFIACLHCDGILQRLAQEVPELRIVTGAASP